MIVHCLLLFIELIEERKKISRHQAKQFIDNEAKEKNEVSEEVSEDDWAEEEVKKTKRSKKKRKEAESEEESLSSSDQNNDEKFTGSGK